MKKTFQEPSVETISLAPQDVIANNMGGTTGRVSYNIFG